MSRFRFCVAGTKSKRITRSLKTKFATRLALCMENLRGYSSCGTDSPLKNLVARQIAITITKITQQLPAKSPLFEESCFMADYVRHHKGHLETTKSTSTINRLSLSWSDEWQGRLSQEKTNRIHLISSVQNAPSVTEAQM